MNGETPEGRFMRFNERSEIQRIKKKYADYVHQDDGIKINLQLSSLAMLLQAGCITWRDYRDSVRALSLMSGLPDIDFRLLAECSRELTRYLLCGSGQSPFTPWEWDAQERRVW